jgi:hypothetical protein
MDVYTIYLLQLYIEAKVGIYRRAEIARKAVQFLGHAACGSLA